MGAGPALGQILEGGAGLDLIFDIALHGVVFIAAAVADVQLPGLIDLLGGHALHLGHGRGGELLSGVQGSGEQGQDLHHVTHNAVVAVLEDLGVGIFVDGYNAGGVLDAFQVLDGPGDAAGNIQVALELLARHTHIAVEGYIFQRLGHGAAGADSGTGGAGQILDELHVLFLADALTGGHHPFSLGDGGVHGDAHGEVVAVLFQVGDQGRHLLLGSAVLEDQALPGTGLRTPGAGGSGGGGLLGGLAQDVGGNHNTLNFVGALVDGGNLSVPVEPLHLHALQVAAAAEDLQRVVGDLQGDVGGILLGHGGLHAVGHVGLLQLGGGVDQEPGAAQFGGHVGNLESDVLLLADGLAKLNPLLGILHSSLIGPLGDTQGLSGDADASPVQGGHGNLEALALLAQQVFLGDLHIVEIQLAGGGGADAHFVIVLLKSEALPALLHDKGGDAPGADAGGGDSEHHIGVSLTAIGDKNFLAVEEVVIPHVLGGGLGAAGVRPGVGLGEAEGPQLLAGA